LVGGGGVGTAAISTGTGAEYITFAITTSCAEPKAKVMLGGTFTCVVTIC
jgi:hypothetical protein